MYINTYKVGINNIQSGSVADPDHFYTDSDQDPDPAFHFDRVRILFF